MPPEGYLSAKEIRLLALGFTQQVADSLVHVSPAERVRVINLAIWWLSVLRDQHVMRPKK